MQEMEKNYVRVRVPRLLDALKKKQYDAHFFETPDEARQFILDRIDTHETVGIGGSMTLREGLQVVEGLREKGIAVYDHWDAGDDRARRAELKRKHREVDVFLAGINAITTDGTLVNLDGGGNRVGNLCFGPRKVIAVAGLNKLVDSLELALDRVRNKAAVLNAMRLKVQTPCVATGVCSDCDAPRRICAALLILQKKPNDIDEFCVVLVNEEMGY